MPMPQSVVDVGLRMEPNLELIRALRPDLILLSPMQQASVPLLERIAPVQIVAFNAPEQPDSYQQARVATRLLAHLLGRPARGAPAARDRTGPGAARCAPEGGWRAAPIYLLRFADRRHGWVLYFC